MNRSFIIEISERKSPVDLLDVSDTPTYDREINWRKMMIVMVWEVFQLFPDVPISFGHEFSTLK